MGETQTHAFQAEVSQVLSLVINSLYSHKEIFLRELVSNAADALDKLRFRAVTEPELIEGGAELRIRIRPDRDAGTLTVSDNGVGMSAEELVKNLGTIAHSGTQELLRKLADDKKESASLSLIGQFGVGFYSAFLVADRVEVVSRAAGTRDAHRWSSDARETFTIEAASRVEQGTDVVLHLKADQREFLEPHRIRQLVKRYSDFIAHPVDLDEGSDSAVDSKRINEGSALWQRPAREISEEQYAELYRHLTHDPEPPVAHRHARIEGTQEFTLLLYIPARAPFDLFLPDSRHGVRLYVKRVFIMDDCDELLPRWLRFVRGVVDSEDLPLNVSRELLQDSRIVRVIRKQVVKHCLDMLEELSQGDRYAELWGQLGPVIKEGLHFDPENRDRLAKLVRFQSSHGEGLTSLADYVQRMKEDQKAIYYVTAHSRETAEKSPHLEVLRGSGYEVLYLTDAVDQFAIEGLGEYEDHPFVSAMDADLKLPDDNTVDSTEREDALGGLLRRFRQVLQEQVAEVRLSGRLTESPVCLVLPEGGLPPYLERLMRLSQRDLPAQKRILEVNPAHPLVESLRALHERDENDEQLKEWMEVLYDQALLAEGSPIEHPAEFASRLTALLTEAARRRTAS